MLTFFRKIRKTYFASGAIRKYTLYALGEILLVMIGILLALQVNNWNTYRRDRIEERQILHNLKQDFENNFQQLQKHNTRRSAMRNAIQEIFSIMDKEQPIHKKPNVDSLIAQTMIALKYNDNSATLNLILNNDKLDLIQNDSLKSLLISWPIIVEDNSDDEAFVYQLTLNQYHPILSQSVTFQAFKNYGPGSPYEFSSKESAKKSSQHKILFDDPAFAYSLGLLDLYNS